MKYYCKRKLLAGFCLMVLILPFFVHSETSESLSLEQTYLYRATFVRAAPGKLLDLIDLFKNRMSVYDDSGDKRPFWWRHTQGDQWDLMMLFPMESYTEYYSKGRVARRNHAQSKSSLSQMEFKKIFQECSSWHVNIGRNQNLIFTRDQGASWDLFTLGCYKDMNQWASGSDLSKEVRDAEAVKAGFEGTDQIGPYMRTLILLHRDTIGVAIK